MLRHPRSRAKCACEPDHETDLDGRRNHPLLREREHSRSQHAEENLRFCPFTPEYSLTSKEEEHRSTRMEILYTNCAGLDVHKKTVKVYVLIHPSTGHMYKDFRTYFTTTEELLKLVDWLRVRG